MGKKTGVGIGEESLVLSILITTDIKVSEKKGNLHIYSHPDFQKRKGLLSVDL